MNRLAKDILAKRDSFHTSENAQNIVRLYEIQMVIDQLDKELVALLIRWEILEQLK